MVCLLDTSFFQAGILPSLVTSYPHGVVSIMKQDFSNYLVNENVCVWISEGTCDPEEEGSKRDDARKVKWGLESKSKKFWIFLSHGSSLQCKQERDLGRAVLQCIGSGTKFRMTGTENVSRKPGVWSQVIRPSLCKWGKGVKTR